MIKFLAVFMMFLFSAQLMADTNPHAHNVVLFYSPTCPHCQKVIAYLQQEHKTVTMKNVKDVANQNEYRALNTTGVPVLVVDGKIIQGETAIIEYFKNHPEVLR